MVTTMEDPIYNLLSPHLPSSGGSDPSTSTYLAHLTTLSLPSLSTTEASTLSQHAQSYNRDLHSLTRRSHQAVIEAATHLTELAEILPNVRSRATDIAHELPGLETAASTFAAKYARSRDAEDDGVLKRRKEALLVERNVDRVGDMLEMPSLLASTASTGSTTTSGYANALDLHAHIRRLHTLHPASELVSSISAQSEKEIENLTSTLITTLQTPALKLAAAMRTVGYLRRLNTVRKGAAADEEEEAALATLFLLARLRALHTTLSALSPLQDLASLESPTEGTGTQGERYLKKYIDLFRSDAFSIVSMYNSIFPSPPSTPSPLSSFALYLTDLLAETLRTYLPNVTDKSARESLLTQVLYCASSLGRLGADFSMVLAELAEPADVFGDGQREKKGEAEWVEVMVKHRVQAARLEVLSKGVGAGARKVSTGG